jgi:hypothetical protein
MLAESYLINFKVPIEKSAVVIHLSANVEKHHSATYYVVDNIKTVRQERGTLLPTLKIRRMNDKWVELDSGKESYLSTVVGRAIDQHESGS